MSSLEYPRLIGENVNLARADGETYLVVSSRLGLADESLVFRPEVGLVLEYLTGEHNLAAIREQLFGNYRVNISEQVLQDLLAALDGIGVLDTPRHHDRRQEVFEAFRQAEIRPASCAGGVYAEDPETLRLQLRHFFEPPRGPGMPQGYLGTKPLRGILTPHIDYPRGGPTFAWAFKELVEQTDATVFVIVGTSHYSSHRFILTRKHFQTPMGLVRNAHGFTDQVARHFGDAIYADEIAHRPEHSLELAVVFLQYLLQDRRDFSIVPLLVGSFHDALCSGSYPAALEDVRRLIEALQNAAAKCSEKVCYIASGDLAHIGPKFGDPWRIDATRGHWCRQADDRLVRCLQVGRGAELSDLIAAENDERRICGYPPTYVMLEALETCRGELLNYDQYVDPGGFEIVSFASMAFYA